MTDHNSSTPYDRTPDGGGLDLTTPNPARRYDYWLGGKDHFAVDRASAKAIEDLFPHAALGARENRAFLHRAVRYLAAERGVRQFLDIGPGLPTASNTHEVAQAVDPGARILYVDNDRMVFTHAQALLRSTAEGRVNFLYADLRNPDSILRNGARKLTIDLGEPVAVVLAAVLHFIADDDLAYTAVRTLMDAAAPGSFLVLSHATTDVLSDDVRAALTGGQVPAASDITARTEKQVGRFFDDNGLALVEPGLTVVSAWRRDTDRDGPPPPAAHVPVYGGIACKPQPETTSLTGADGDPAAADQPRPAAARAPNQRTEHTPDHANQSRTSASARLAGLVTVASTPPRLSALVADDQRGSRRPRPSEPSP